MSRALIKGTLAAALMFCVLGCALLPFAAGLVVDDSIGNGIGYGLAGMNELQNHIDCKAERQAQARVPPVPPPVNWTTHDPADDLPYNVACQTRASGQADNAARGVPTKTTAPLGQFTDSSGAVTWTAHDPANDL